MASSARALRIGDRLRVIVTSVRSEMNAAYADAGPYGEVLVSLTRINGLQRGRVIKGRRVVVEITKEAQGKKAPKATMALAVTNGCIKLVLDGTALAGAKIPARPELEFAAVIKESQRSEIRVWFEGMCASEGVCALIGDVKVVCLARCAGYSLKRIARDFARACERALAFQEQARQGSHPELLFSAQDAPEERGIVLEQTEPVVAQGQANPQDVEFLSTIEPIYPGQTEPAGASRIALSLFSGGSLVIEKTEALWAIDVNTGVTRAQAGESACDIANDEALEVLCNIIVEQGIYGLVVVDFAGDTTEERLHQRLREISLNLAGTSELHVSGEVKLNLALIARGQK